MTIQDLYDRRYDMVENARKFLEEHTDKDGKFSAEDAAAYDKMEADIIALDRQIECFTNQEKHEQFSVPNAQPILNYHGADNPFVVGTLQTSRPGIYGQAYRRR